MVRSLGSSQLGADEHVDAAIGRRNDMARLLRPTDGANIVESQAAGRTLLMLPMPTSIRNVYDTNAVRRAARRGHRVPNTSPRRRRLDVGDGGAPEVRGQPGSWDGGAHRALGGCRRAGGSGI